MKRIAELVFGVICAAILLTIAVPANSSGLPYDAVRMIQDADGEQRCSAVVIEPGVAITAQHCLTDNGLYVDGYWVEEAITYRTQTPDVAIIFAPGLECPCAPLGFSPEAGDQTLAVGFAGSLNGEYRITEVGRVKMVARLDEFAPWVAEEAGAFAAARFIFTDPIIQPGDSGGALFAMQDGEWRVVGINSISLFKPESCVPFFGCTEPLASGFAPIEDARELLR